MSNKGYVCVLIGIASLAVALKEWKKSRTLWDKPNSVFASGISRVNKIQPKGD